MSRLSSLPSSSFPVSPPPQGPSASPAPCTTNLEVVLTPALLPQASSAADTHPLPRALLLLVEVVGPPPFFSLPHDDLSVMCLSLTPPGRPSGFFGLLVSPHCSSGACVT